MEWVVKNSFDSNDIDRVHLAVGVAAFALGLKSQEVLASGRGTPAVSFARQVAMYLCHVGLGMSLAQIARALDRDRSTVAHGCHTIEDRREQADFDEWIDQVEQGLRAILPLSGAEAA